MLVWVIRWVIKAYLQIYKFLKHEPNDNIAKYHKPNKLSSAKDSILNKIIVIVLDNSLQV